jgi:hypothetical protein
VVEEVRAEDQDDDGYEQEANEDASFVIWRFLFSESCRKHLEIFIIVQATQIQLILIKFKLWRNYLQLFLKINPWCCTLKRS